MGNLVGAIGRVVGRAVSFALGYLTTVASPKSGPSVCNDSSVLRKA